MKHLDLFSGIGGFALACQWAGIETIGFVEIDKYCQKVLRRHWPDVPIEEDIKDVKENTFQRPVDLITGGFPCQPFSVAGKRKGENDDRYLWPEMLRIIETYRPTWILGENVTGIINLALDQVLSDLEGAGYATETLVIPACAVNAWHRRDRVWIVAHAKCNELGCSQRGSDRETETVQTEYRTADGTTRRTCRTSAIWTPNERLVPWIVANTQYDGCPRIISNYNGECVSDQNGQYQNETENGERLRIEVKPRSENDANTNREGLQGLFNATGEQGSESRDEQPIGCGGIPNTSQWAVEPELGRVAHGISHRVDRLKCLGNAIVPQVAFELIRVIKEVDGYLPYL